MNEIQLSIFKRVQDHLHQMVTKIERLRYVTSLQADGSDGELSLWFDEGVLRFDSDSDGERLRVECGPWQDPFDEPLDEGNREYVAKYGKWKIFDVSQEAPYINVIGSSLDDVLPILNQIGKLIGVSLLLGEQVLNIFADCDELYTTWGKGNLPRWPFVSTK